MKKLFRITRSDFKLPYGSDSGTRTPLVAEAKNLPCMHWPDGRWCLPANIYLLSLYDRGLSRQGIGGTLATYASNIGHLVRFCFERGVDFHLLTDGQFTHFIRGLRGALRPSGERLRSDNHVLAIATNCLDFLEHIARERGESNLLGRSGRIRAYRNRTAIGHRRGEFSSWCHAALPVSDPKRRRHPIGTTEVEMLRAAVLPASGSIAQRRRRYVMIRCLEITGGRRIELANLTVASVANAISAGHHRLELLTAKRRGGKPDFREIPCTLNDLAEIWEYIKWTRKKIISSTLGSEHDHGYVFVSERTGKPIRPNTITQEIHTLAKHAKISGRAAPHMFRHRYITKIFVALIQQYDLKTPDDLRRALVGLKDIKQQLMEWTGHRSMQSLDRYIDFAFAEVDGLVRSTNAVNAVAELHSLRHAIQALAAQMASEGGSDVMRRLEALLERSSVGASSANSEAYRGNSLADRDA